tara:strand:- start:944 stop:1117 length:174 start_codon:yes stop_codon:yes gene_type:complete
MRIPWSESIWCDCQHCQEIRAQQKRAFILSHTRLNVSGLPQDQKKMNTFPNNSLNND